MQSSRPLLHQEYNVSDLRSEFKAPPVSNERAIHTLFATVLNDIDRRADIHQSIKPDIVSGIAQAWLYFAEEIHGVNVKVEQHQSGVDTSVSDPAEGRPASSVGRRGTDGPPFDESIRAEHNPGTPIGQFERDMRRLDDLRRKYAGPGLNTYEGNEAEELRDKYGLSHREWWQGKYLNDE